MANDAEADFHCVIFTAVSSKHSSYHKYSFTVFLLFTFAFHFHFFCLFFYILRFTVALPLIFPCVIMITFCSYYFTLGSPFLISPVASLGLPSHESLNNQFFLLQYNLWQNNKLKLKPKDHTQHEEKKECNKRSTEKFLTKLEEKSFMRLIWRNLCGLEEQR